MLSNASGNAPAHRSKLMIRRSPPVDRCQEFKLSLQHKQPKEGGEPSIKVNVRNSETMAEVFLAPFEIESVYSLPVSRSVFLRAEPLLLLLGRRTLPNRAAELRASARRRS